MSVGLLFLCIEALTLSSLFLTYIYYDDDSLQRQFYRQCFVQALKLSLSAKYNIIKKEKKINFAKKTLLYPPKHCSIVKLSILACD